MQPPIRPLPVAWKHVTSIVTRHFSTGARLKMLATSILSLSGHLAGAAGLYRLDFRNELGFTWANFRNTTPLGRH